MEYDDLKHLRLLGCLSIQQAAALAGVTVRQFRRWEKGESRVPLAALRLLRLACLGDLGALFPEWKGWRLRRHGLLPPGVSEREYRTPGEIAAIPFHRALIAELQKQARQSRPKRPTARILPFRPPR